MSKKNKTLTLLSIRAINISDVYVSLYANSLFTNIRLNIAPTLLENK